jgi:allantoinase
MGWMGPGAAESRVTADLLKEAGYTHSLGWPVDDQPIWMRTRAGPLLSVPYPMELNDMGTNVLRDHTGQDFADMIVDQFEEMLENSTEQPLVMAVALHTFICGQPFRMRPLRKALKHCVQHPHRDRVWYTRAVDIANYCFSLPPGMVVGS